MQAVFLEIAIYPISIIYLMKMLSAVQLFWSLFLMYLGVVFGH